MKASGKGRTQGRSSGSSRLVTYALIGLIAILVGYYLVLPVFTPKSTGTTNPNGPKISLSAGSDIPGAMVSISGQNLAPNQNINATFAGSSLVLTNGTSSTNSCRTGGTGAFAACEFWVPKGNSGPYVIKVTAGNTTAQSSFAIPQYVPPVSTILVTLTSISLGLVTQLVTRRMVDLNAERRMRAEVNAFNKEKREATLAKDKVKLDKLNKRNLAVQQEQFKVQRARLKVTAITFIPLLGVYYLMATFLGGYGVIVAYTPIPIPYFASPTQYSYLQVSLFWWYFLSSFTFSTMIGKLLHTTP
ncbi:MAG: DUF106 domain-containing protein [Thaumarchaeota archaeon]|nr:DUF106 domain-containing protein [Nitrososphaerota archaeon]